jgi:hypothetical protein
VKEVKGVTEVAEAAIVARVTETSEVAEVAEAAIVALVTEMSEVAEVAEAAIMNHSKNSNMISATHNRRTFVKFTRKTPTKTRPSANTFSLTRISTHLSFK